MKPHNIQTMRFKLEGDKVLIAPMSRPNDWREVGIHLLDNWAIKQWREMALQPINKELIK